MRYIKQKTIKNVIKQYLNEQENNTESPQRGRGGNEPTPAPTPGPAPIPNTGDGGLVAVTATAFQGIESILGKVAKTVEDGVMYVPNKIMEQYKKSLKETKYRYKDENGDVYEYSYSDMGNKISIGEVKLTTPVKRMLYNVTTEQREPGPTKKASEYPELKEFFWGDEGQNKVGNQTQVENESETTKQIETLRPYMSKGFFGKEGVDFEEIQITTLPGYYIGIKLLKPREGKTVVLLYDNIGISLIIPSTLS
jgi:hypothetical protein